MRRKTDVLGRLYVHYQEVNWRHFGGMLPMMAIYLRCISKKMKGKALTTARTVCNPDGRARYIELDEAFALRGAIAALKDVIVHEMVHVWQGEMGIQEAHGPMFRMMARRLGIPTTVSVD